MAERAPLDLAPSEGLERTSGEGRVLLLACGALGREIVDLVEANRWTAFDIQCLPAKWHNTPDLIVPALREKIRANRDHYESLYVLYGDCGTGGLIDRATRRRRGGHAGAGDALGPVDGRDGAHGAKLRERRGRTANRRTDVTDLAARGGDG